MKRMNVSSLITVTAVMLCFGLLSGPIAFAADQSPCTDDIAKYCKDASKSRRATIKCLEQHESQLSDACKAYEAKMGTARAESREVAMQQMRFRQACKDDMTKLCKDAGPGGPLTCLKAHEKELSAPCDESIKAMQKRKE